MNADGTGLRKLTTGPRAFTPAWSPDGGSIVYISDAGAPGS
jgi:Tol biopolymer transport system component